MTHSKTAIPTTTTLATLDDAQLVTTTGGVFHPIIPSLRDRDRAAELSKTLIHKGTDYAKRGWDFVKRHVHRGDVLL